MAFTFNIVKPICVIREGENGWNKELNYVSWNNGQPKLDIRVWNSDHTKMDKGVTFTDEEADVLFMALSNYMTEVKK